MIFPGKKPPATTSPALNRQQALACIPIRNPGAEEEPGADGILLIYPVEVKPLFRGLMRRLTGRDTSSIRRKLQLDHMGSGVWGLIDNQRSSREIIRLFQGQHQLEEREAEIAVSSFLKELGKRGLIAMAAGS
ncbi:PqqD family protein [Desulfogranum mediterraneum]|uniref:PqqD family protein n=1 Tax=Desulfogranum mediterraneum TaxID=160661 RepID=UPI00040696A1|nr:PqqD family protein [Desulfogranum mediterraneum]